MFDKYLIEEDSLRNTGADGTVGGFSFSARLGYYRGLGVSMIDGLEIAIDGEPVARDAVTLDVGGGPQTLDELLETFDRRWEFGARATIGVQRAGGFPDGSHRLSLKEVLRISYLPFPLLAEDAKEVSAT